jgi:hypothetical protein
MDRTIPDDQTVRTDIAHLLHYLAHMATINADPLYQMPGGPTVDDQLQALLADVLALVRGRHSAPLEAITDALSLSRHTQTAWMAEAGRKLTGDLTPAAPVT